MNRKTGKQGRILLVEDEESLAIGLEFNLKEEGYTVDWVSDGRNALDLLKNKTYDLMILDIMLPFVNGFEIARIVRQDDPQLPILILTARTDAKDRIKGLELGADDYMTKPFHLKELLLRVNGMLRRKKWYQSASTDKPIFRFSENEINFESLTATSRDKTLQLTVHEAMLLKYLVDNRGKVLSREDILQKVWNITSEVETRTVDNFIVRLRKYFEIDPANPQFIKSKRGVGYYFSETAVE